MATAQHPPPQVTASQPLVQPPTAQPSQSKQPYPLQQQVLPLDGQAQVAVQLAVASKQDVASFRLASTRVAFPPPPPHTSSFPPPPLEPHPLSSRNSPLGWAHGQYALEEEHRFLMREERWSPTHSGAAPDAGAAPDGGETPDTCGFRSGPLSPSGGIGGIGQLMGQSQIQTPQPHQPPYHHPPPQQRSSNRPAVHLHDQPSQQQPLPLKQPHQHQLSPHQLSPYQPDQPPHQQPSLSFLSPLRLSPVHQATESSIEQYSLRTAELEQGAEEPLTVAASRQSSLLSRLQEQVLCHCWRASAPVPLLLCRFGVVKMGPWVLPLPTCIALPCRMLETC